MKINTFIGLNNNPDFSIDNSGIIHCVWSFRIEENHRVIYYSKSIDDGLSWSAPENISQNDSLWMENPHIVADSQNNLHLTYDYNTGNPGETLIVYKKFEGQNWSEPDTVSTDWPGARHNRLVIDHNDKIYCFWFHDFQNGTTFLRTLENGQWGEIMTPYDNDNSYYVDNVIVDSTNVIHCSGYHFYNGQTSYDQEIVYSTYENQVWSDLTEVSQSHDFEVWAGNDIALDNKLKPHIVWRQTVSNTIPANDATMYAKFNGSNWSSPEIIVEDPSDQAIAIDKNNKVHIVNNEKFENGYRLVHYQFVDNEWVGQLITENQYDYFDNKLFLKNQFLYLLNGRVDTIYPSESSITLRKYELKPNTVESFSSAFNSLTIYPNPTHGKTIITYILKETKHIALKIYSLEGKLLKTIMKKKQAPGEYQIIWKGTDKNGKEVDNGLYLIRLQAGRQIMTRSVEIIK
ncbi:MAG: T9SS type A sorting domain-containing protein [Bacteroidales bacterium]|nr:T9SS type A sorting domain-containing protein [Bacteroidales bacterium]